jgi:hypothetical protein
MKPLGRRPRRKQRPVEVSVDFLVPFDSSVNEPETELVYISNDIELEFAAGLRYVAVTSNVGEAGWIVLKVGEWSDSVAALEGRRIVISGIGSELQRRFGGKVLVQNVSPASLESVVFKVSVHDYNTVSEDHDGFQSFQSDGTVFRPGKTIIMPSGFPLEVVLCEPVRQGILGEETDIILVTDANDYNGNKSNGLGTPFSTSSQNDTNSELDISQFLALPSSEADLEEEIPDTTALIPPQDDPISRGIPLRVVVLERPVDKFSLDPCPADSEDNEFRVYAHMRDIARIGVFSGDWVWLVIRD